MRFAVIVLTCGLILCSLANAVTSPGEQITKLDEPAILNPVSNPDVSRTACMLKKHNDTLAGYWGGYAKGMRTVTFFDPMLTCGGTGPFEIQSFGFTLLDAGNYQWPVTLDVVIYDAETTDAPCHRPGTELCRYTVTCDSITFAFPNAGLVSFGPGCCVNRPFYIGLEYNDPGAGPFPSVAFDSHSATDSCDNYAFYSDSNWYEWSDFWNAPVPGYPIYYVNVETQSATCMGQEPIVYSIESLHDNYEALVGTRVSVVGSYTGEGDNMLVSGLSDYFANQPMPSKSALHLISDTLADSMDLALVVATGYLSAEPDPFPFYADDSVTLYLYVNAVEKVLDPLQVPAAMPKDSYQDQRESDAVCDSCKFAILISGGINGNSNHDRYWNNLAMLYKHKVDNENYCPGNIKVLYYTGTSENTAEIPQANVDSCTKANIQKAHEDIAKKIAACSRAGMKTTLQKLITNHGSPTGICLLGDKRLDGGTLRGYQQMCVDSGLTYLYDEMIQCYAGNEADSMKSIDDKGHTEVRVNADAGNVPSWSKAHYDVYLKTKIDSLAAGHTYDESVAYAAEAYSEFLQSLVDNWEAWLTATRQWLIDHPVTGTPDDTVRERVIKDTTATRGNITTITDGQGSSQGRSNIWARIHMTHYCEWKRLIVPQGGQLCLNFSGDPLGNGGNVTVYKDSVAMGEVLKNKVAVWNWNIPGAAGYMAGYNPRYINGDTLQSTSFWIHNDDGNYTITAQLRTDQPDPESPSNPDEFPGWSLGGTDDSNGEFGDIQTELVQMSLVDQPGIMLSSMPQLLGGCGTGTVEAQQFIPYTTPWHSQMELRVVISDVLNPGPLAFTISNATNPIGTFNITTPGAYTFDCGAITISNPSGEFQTVQLDAGFTGGCFAIDSWGLRTTAFDVATGCCDLPGDVTGDSSVDIADLTFLVNYMFKSGPGPSCFEEGDVNADCSLDIADLTFIVAYMFKSGPPPADCHVCSK